MRPRVGHPSNPVCLASIAIFFTKLWETPGVGSFCLWPYWPACLRELLNFPGVASGPSDGDVAPVVCSVYNRMGQR